MPDKVASAASQVASSAADTAKSTADAKVFLCDGCIDKAKIALYVRGYWTCNDWHS